MRDLDTLFVRLAASSFRGRFALGPKERDHLDSRGLPVILDHAANFIARRLAPASPVNEGKQTPMRGHPVFVAQHATATCCRACLEKWHGIAKGRALAPAEQHYVVAVIARWLQRGPN